MYREVRHRSRSTYFDALETAYGEPWYRIFLTSGSIRAFTLDRADPVTVHAWMPWASLRVRAHEFYHAAEHGEHPNPFLFDVRCGHPVRVFDREDLIPAYLEAIEDAQITIEHEPEK